MAASLQSLQAVDHVAAGVVNNMSALSNKYGIKNGLRINDAFKSVSPRMAAQISPSNLPELPTLKNRGMAQDTGPLQREKKIFQKPQLSKRRFLNPSRSQDQLLERGDTGEIEKYLP